jgi:hypothetical protein
MNRNGKAVKKPVNDVNIRDRAAWQQAERELASLESYEPYQRRNWSGYDEALATARQKVESYRFFWHDSVGGQVRMAVRKTGRFRFRDTIGRITPDGFEVYPLDRRPSRVSMTNAATPISLEPRPGHSERLREINRNNTAFWNARKEQR